MKRLISLIIVTYSMLCASAFAASDPATFPCPSVEQVNFSKTDNGNGSFSITATANPTTNMPPDLGSWFGTQIYAGVAIIGQQPTLHYALGGTPYSLACVYDIPAILTYNNQPTTISISVIPNGPGANTYKYEGTPSAILAEKLIP